MNPELQKAIAHLTVNALDYMASSKDENIADLNRRLGYCEAILDLILFANSPERKQEEVL